MEIAAIATWLTDNWVWLLPLINPLASAICATTPTPKDDAVWGKLYKWLEVLALNVGRAKDKSNSGRSTVGALLVLALAGVLALGLAACSAKQVHDSQQTAEAAAAYIQQAEATLRVVQKNYAEALKIFVDSPEKRAVIVSEVDPILAKAQAALTAAKALAEVYAAMPVEENWEKMWERHGECMESATEAGIAVVNLVKELQE